MIRDVPIRMAAYLADHDVPIDYQRRHVPASHACSSGWCRACSSFRSVPSPFVPAWRDHSQLQPAFLLLRRVFLGLLFLVFLQLHVVMPPLLLLRVNPMSFVLARMCSSPGYWARAWPARPKRCDRQRWCQSWSRALTELEIAQRSEVLGTDG